MIRDLSETLKAVLKDPAQMASFPELNAADIVFDRPTEPFTPPRATVDLFLYDIRENVDLRSNEPTIERSNGEVILTPPPLRLACSYLATAWPADGADRALQEHRLLAQTLRVLSRYPSIPSAFLKGSLAVQAPPLPMVALHPDAMKNLSEFWTAIGTKLRASLTVTVTISVPVSAAVPKFLVTTRTTEFPNETWRQIGGRVRDPGGQGIAGAWVDLLDMGQQTTTDAGGQYTFLQVPAGNHPLRVVAVGFEPKTVTLVVPGRPEDYDVALTPL